MDKQNRNKLGADKYRESWFSRSFGIGSLQRARRDAVNYNEKEYKIIFVLAIIHRLSLMALLVIFVGQFIYHPLFSAWLPSFIIFVVISLINFKYIESTMDKVDSGNDE